MDGQQPSAEVIDSRQQHINDIEQSCFRYAQLSDSMAIDLGGPASLEASRQAVASELEKLTALLPDSVRVALIENGLAGAVGRQVGLANEADAIRANLERDPKRYAFDGGVHELELSKGDKAKSTLEAFWNKFGDVL